VPDGSQQGAAVVAAAPRKLAEAQQQVAALERSVADPAASVGRFLRDQYLASGNGDVTPRIREMYAAQATIYGAPMDIEAIVQAKAGWFAQWSSWTLALEPGSLTVTPRGEDRADAVFTMSYDYVPRGAGVARATGRALVSLALVKSSGVWRVAAETSAAAN